MNMMKAEVNDIIQVKVIEDPNSLSYRSRVEDVVEDQMIIGWPTSNGVLVPIHLDGHISLSFVREDAAYVFLGVVQDRKKEPFPVLNIRVLGLPERIQRRQFFRMKVPIGLEIRGVMSLPNNPQADLFIETQTYDLSGSGLAIRSEIPIPVDTIVEAKLTLDDLPPLKLTAKAVSSELITTRHNTKLSHVGFNFLDLKEGQRMRIIRYLFRMQMQQLANLPGNTSFKTKKSGEVIPISQSSRFRSK
jgi:c-di-GMP-binding flagellar brake protein YcgR